MKQLLFLIITSMLLLTNCGSEKENKNREEPKGTPLMQRKKMDSGLEYEILKEGSGASPQTGDRVTVHYTGWLNEDEKPGAKFDSSLDRGKPFTFSIGRGQVIKGWDQGVASMKIGEKRRLFIPSELGYGAYGAGSKIPPHADLIFDVELLGIEQ